jgi:hypothetical protein
MQHTNEISPEDVALVATTSRDTSAEDGRVRKDEPPTNRLPSQDLGHSEDPPTDSLLALESLPPKFAPEAQIVEAVAAVRHTLGHVSQLRLTLKAIFKTNPAEFKQMDTLAESITKDHAFFIAWCNSIRRLSPHDLQRLWKARHGAVVVKLTADIGNLAKNTSTVATTALEALGENSALKALKNSDLLAKINRNWQILMALYFSIETKRCLNKLMWVIIKQDPDSLNAVLSQPLLLRPPPLMFRFIYDTIQSGLMCLAEIDHQEWNAVRIRLSTWGTGKFDESMTLDFLMGQNDVDSLRESIKDGLHFLLYSVGRL